MASYNAVRILQTIDPDAGQNAAGYILWNRTPYPFGKVGPREFYKAASTAVRANRNGIVLCDHCNNKVTSHKFECDRCHQFMMDAANAKSPDRHS